MTFNPLHPLKNNSEYRTSLLHAFALNGFAVAQPVLDLLGDNIDFFVARGSRETDLIAMLLVLMSGLPLLLAVVYKALSVISIRAMRMSHNTVVAALVTVIALPVLKKPELTSTAILLLAAGIGILFTIGYRALGAVRLFLTMLSPMPLIFAGFFLFGASMKELHESTQTAPQSKSSLKSSDTPVVMLIFDEFALTALMDADRGIDKTLFPNFHKLAEDASWYRNATTVATATMISVPAMLTGNYPREFVSQSHTNYPDTLFTMLADSHRMNVFESTTSLCSPELCPHSIKLTKTGLVRLKILLADVSAIYLHIIAPPSMNSRLPVINMTWENYWQLDEAESWQRHNYLGRLEQMRFFVDSITAAESPGLHLMHTNFPHLPYQYLPSGNRYQGEWEVPGLDFSTDRWGDNLWMLTQAYQRFMLQAATADLFIGELLDHLKSIGIYDESLIVISADHGVSFYPDSLRRDAPPFDTLEKDVLPVPLFIKYPYQEAGQVSDENVETIDILPTIADVLGAGEGLAMDGRSLLGQQAPRAEKLAFHAYKDFQQHRSDASGELKYETLQWKLDIFGHSAGVDSLFKIGKFRGLVGSRLDAFDIREPGTLDIALDTPSLYQDVDPDSGFMPSRISGTIHTSEPLPEHHLAVGVNGVIRAVTEVYPAQQNAYRFTAMVPENSFEKGNNTVSIFLVSADSHGDVGLLKGHGQNDLVPTRHDLSTWRLHDNRITGPGVEYPVVAEKLKGALEHARVDGGTIEFFGWAIDAAGHDTVEKIMIFEDGQFVYSNVAGMPREEGVLYDAPEIILLGFQFIIPENLFHAPGRSDIRLFAISKHGYATELGYFDGYKWIR